MYPEGGELIAGLPTGLRRSFTPAHKPADLAGVVVDESGREVGASAASTKVAADSNSHAGKSSVHAEITEPAASRSISCRRSKRRGGDSRGARHIGSMNRFVSTSLQRRTTSSPLSQAEVVLNHQVSKAPTRSRAVTGPRPTSRSTPPTRRRRADCHVLERWRSRWRAARVPPTREVGARHRITDAKAYSLEVRLGCT